MADETLIIETPEHVELHFALATIGNRFLACMIDHVIQFFALIVTYIIVRSLSSSVRTLEGVMMGNEKVKTAQNQLDQMAEMTGGVLVNAQSEEDLEGAYARVAAELHTLYSLGYLPDKMKHDGGFRKISVKINREGSVAKTRKGYFDK